MLDYFIKNNESICYGCRACVQVCSANALSMKQNADGFFYPVLDETKCVNCHLCEKVCPEMNPPDGEIPLDAYAVQNRSKHILLQSSSGGMFRLLADHIIEAGGYVTGCVWNENNRPVLSVVKEKTDLESMQGSKYLSSSTENTYTKVKSLLDNEQIVLFSGSPCQCAGLLKFLRKPYENLITLDFLCHGMPSQKVFDSFITFLKEKYGEKIENFEFRDKSLKGWGHVETFDVKSKKKYTVGMNSSYLFGFLNGYFNRYSCYSCKFRGKERVSDFTMSDYWGVEKHHNEFDIKLGVSALTVNTVKAQNILMALSDRAILIPTRIEWIAEENPSLLHKHDEEIPRLRKTIFQEIDRDGWKKVEKRYLRCSGYVMKKMWYAIPIPIQNRIKKLIKN